MLNKLQCFPCGSSLSLFYLINFGVLVAKVTWKSQSMTHYKHSLKWLLSSDFECRCEENRAGWLKLSRHSFQQGANMLWWEHALFFLSRKSCSLGYMYLGNETAHLSAKLHCVQCISYRHSATCKTCWRNASFAIPVFLACGMDSCSKPDWQSTFWLGLLTTEICHIWISLQEILNSSLFPKRNLWNSPTKTFKTGT